MRKRRKLHSETIAMILSPPSPTLACVANRHSATTILAATSLLLLLVAKTSTSPVIAGSLPPQQQLLNQLASAQEPLQLPPATRCQLPGTWHGRWMQSKDKDSVRITKTSISDKGICRDQKGDKYLFEVTTTTTPAATSAAAATAQQQTVGKQSCLVCMAISERHLNVLQYKESSCLPVPQTHVNSSRATSASLLSSSVVIDENHALLDEVCSEIPGDGQLESLFKLETPAIECPFSGQYSFTHDNCREPVSTVESCVDKKQLTFMYNVCPNNPNAAEPKSEVLKCYADWTEGNMNYMIGRLEYSSNPQESGKFRCFLYEKSSDGRSILVSSSNEESCFGLSSPTEGAKTMRLAVRPQARKCQFPSVIKTANWLSVDNSLIYMFNTNSTQYQVKETKEGNVIEEAACLQQYIIPNGNVLTTKAASSVNAASLPYNQLPQTQPQAPPVVRQHSRSSGNSLYQQPRFNALNYDTTTPSSLSRMSNSIVPQASPSHHLINDLVYLIQITKNCYTTNYCAKFYQRASGIVQIDYFPTLPGANPCRGVNEKRHSPHTQILTSTNLERQPCPFDGIYTIEASVGNDYSTYDPSTNLFTCPSQSALLAQCESPTQLKLYSSCQPPGRTLKNLYCLGSWTSNNMVRFLLSSEDRVDRYSAYYYLYNNTPQPHHVVGLSSSSSSSTSISSQQPNLPHNQNQLSGSSSSSVTVAKQSPPIAGHMIDLRIALIRPPHLEPAREMHVQLTYLKSCAALSSPLSYAAQHQPPTQMSQMPFQSQYAPRGHYLIQNVGAANGASLMPSSTTTNSYVVGYSPSASSSASILSCRSTTLVLHFVSLATSLLFVKLLH